MPSKYILPLKSSYVWEDKLWTYWVTIVKYSFWIELNIITQTSCLYIHVCSICTRMSIFKVLTLIFLRFTGYLQQVALYFDWIRWRSFSKCWREKLESWGACSGPISIPYWVVNHLLLIGRLYIYKYHGTCDLVMLSTCKRENLHSGA